MRKLGILLCVFATLFLMACKKNVIKADKNFSGEWENVGAVAYYDLSIGGGGYANYEGYDGRVNETQMGEAKVNKRKDEFIIGKRKWKINAYPHEVSDPTAGLVWKMSLDGVEYTKY
jgi:hypothetical protein